MSATVNRVRDVRHDEEDRDHDGDGPERYHAGFPEGHFVPSCAVLVHGLRRVLRIVECEPLEFAEMVLLPPQLISLGHLLDHTQNLVPKRDALVWGVVKAAKYFLVRRPYDLRHAWLAAGVSAPQVAEWAGR
jgi:hypothetical protein